MLPPGSLAPAGYAATLDGKPTGHRLAISTGVNDSTMLITQTIAPEQIRSTGGNFVLGNAFDESRRYGTIRGSIIGSQQDQAHRDLKQVWPNVVFSTVNYAAFAAMDGADPMNQRTSDIPATHVFLDWGTGRLGAISGLCIEKSHDPTALLAVAMNGQLMGGPMPSAVQQVCYRRMLNSMLAAGLRSNWWLNWGAISPDAKQRR